MQAAAQGLARDLNICPGTHTIAWLYHCSSCLNVGVQTDLTSGSQMGSVRCITSDLPQVDLSLEGTGRVGGAETLFKINNTRKSERLCSWGKAGFTIKKDHLHWKMELILTCLTRWTPYLIQRKSAEKRKRRGARGWCENLLQQKKKSYEEKLKISFKRKCLGAAVKQRFLWILVRSWIRVMKLHLELDAGLSLTNVSMDSGEKLLF